MGTKFPNFPLDPTIFKQQLAMTGARSSQLWIDRFPELFAGETESPSHRSRVERPQGEDWVRRVERLQGVSPGPLVTAELVVTLFVDGGGTVPAFAGAKRDTRVTCGRLAVASPLSGFDCRDKQFRISN
jgi:hypothetical protein